MAKVLPDLLDSRDNYKLDKQSTEFKIIAFLARENHKTLSDIAKGLGQMAGSTISATIFGGTASRWKEKNFLEKGLLNFEVSGYDKLHFKFSLSFTGFLYYIANETKSERTTDKFFNQVKGANDNFGFALFREHEMLDKVFSQYLEQTFGEDNNIHNATGTKGSRPSLFSFYREVMIPQLFEGTHGHYFLPLDTVDKPKSIIGQTIEEYKRSYIEAVKEDRDFDGPEYLYKLVEHSIEIDSLISDLEKGVRGLATPSVHWELHRLYNLYNDEKNKLLFVGLFLDNFYDFMESRRGLFLSMPKKDFPIESFVIFEHAPRLMMYAFWDYWKEHEKRNKLIRRLIIRHIEREE
jgi:hypothetical protein